MTKAASPCEFCSIERGATAAHIVLSNDLVVAFLDTRPLFPGHCLLTPRRHVETLMDVPAEELGALFTSVQRLARAVEAGMGADGVFIAINNRVSQSVSHMHVHVVPRRTRDGLRGFFWPRQRYDSEESMAAVAASIRGHLG